ncbi:MAG TPA: hypothetical protein VIN61_07485 [Gammaproteobacteria bacterium]
MLHDVEDRLDGRTIACPTLVLWSEGGPLDRWYEAAGGPLELWKPWARDVRGRAVSGGHFFPEQNAAETIDELRRFLR